MKSDAQELNEMLSKGKTVVRRLMKHIARSHPGLSLGRNQESVLLRVIST